MINKKLAAQRYIFGAFFLCLVTPGTVTAQQPPPRPFWDVFGKPPHRGDSFRPPRPGGPNDPNRPPRPGDRDHPRPAPRHSNSQIKNLKTQGSTPITGEVWVDNWFKLYVNGKKLIEDSVSIRTERSFNAERFRFRASKPITFAFEFRDFMQNATGLEYIGSRRQQIGDGGAIAQFKNSRTGALITATNHQWRCLTVQYAPLNQDCARMRIPIVNKGACAQRIRHIPKNWMSSSFDDSSWPQATEYSAREVRPKDGYDRISWKKAARFIWGADLKRDNVLLCRLIVR
ncbi:MAG: PEBP family protein [bacterium]|nr:PEBP family protein [bacterium]